MRVSSINPVQYSNRVKKTQQGVSQTSFEGKHKYAKGLAAVFGSSAATAAGVGLGIIMSGGLAAIPFVIGAGAVAAAGGAALGHELDKTPDDKDNKKQK